MKNIFVTGYYGTGSSAIIDLLSEYTNVNVVLGKRYEHTLFMCAKGLFDLEQRLFGTNSNQMIRDVAINDFINEMAKLDKYDFGWYGTYNAKVGDKFKSAYERFVNSISQIGGQDLFSHTKKIRFSLIKSILQVGAHFLRGYRITKLGRVYVHDKDKTRYLTVSHDEFLKQARIFTKTYLEMFNSADINVYDHVMSPEQCEEVDRLFEEAKLIIVDRDPRDIYISANYIWNNVANGKQIAPFPLGVEGFCENWKMMHENTNRYNSENILHISFDDLIYKYDETVGRIEAFCGIDRKTHENKTKCFDPSISIKNTQVFSKDEKFKNENSIIEKKLKDYLYNFPYRTDSDISEAKDI